MRIQSKDRQIRRQKCCLVEENWIVKQLVEILVNLDNAWLIDERKKKVVRSK